MPNQGRRWFEQRKEFVGTCRPGAPKDDAPDLWTRCVGCGEMRYNEALQVIHRVCHLCGHHFRLDAIRWLRMLCDEATGGVAASFAMLGDIILAEPEALIGFAGPREIRETIGEELPAGFQTSEYLLAHGMVDAIVLRTEMRTALARLLRQLLGLPSTICAHASIEPATGHTT